MKLFALIGFCLIFGCTGCTGQHCFELGGTWKDITGNIKYCYDKHASEEATRPVLVPEEKTQEKMVALLESDIIAINEKLSQQTKVKVSEVKVSENPIKILLRLIGKP